MGYLIKNNDFIKKVINIPSSDVQLMDNSAPYTLVTTNNLFIAVPVLCYIKILNNQTIPYSGFNHLHLTSSANYSTGDLCATYSANAGGTLDLGPGQLYSFLINFQTSPNRFGGQNAIKNLEIFFDILPTAGDGDMEVTLYYLKA
jgi:hypothetical protein